MKSVVLNAPEKLELTERQTPSPGPKEVLVRVKAAGIGGTDLRIYRGLLPAKLPLVLGQEFVGEIEQVGSGVAGLSKGNAIAVEPVVRDGTCAYCRTGNYCLCDNLKVFGIHLDGGYSELVSVPEYALHRIPAKVSFEEAVMAVPVAVAYYAVSRSQPKPGSTFVIIGAGPIGLSALQIAKLNGASKVLVAEPLEARAKLARTLGASAMVDSDPPKFLASIKLETSDQLADVVIEATGNSESVNMALASAKRDGTVVFAGAFGKPASIDMTNIVRKNLTVRGSWLYPNMFSKALGLIAESKIKVKEYISSRFSLTHAVKAFAAAQDSLTTKVVLVS